LIKKGEKMSKTIDQQFIEYVVQSLVSKPDAVVVERKIDEKGVLLTLTVDPEDLGRVIGKRGATAQSLRTLLRALGTKQEARYNLKIVDNGVPREEREQQSGGDGWASEPSSSTSETTDTSSESETVLDADEEDSSNDEDAIARTRRELEDLDDLDV
jgi:predicted RNA-binding protein YlqC (UPF0109 family)